MEETIKDGLPRASWEPTDLAPKPEPDERVRILVVDDLPDKLLAIRVALEELGEHVVCASSGREALRRLIHEDFAVILLDVNMPMIDGIETAQLIRKREKSRHTPIIFVTAYADDMRELEGYSLGAVDYILSPVVPEILRSKVAVFVDLYKKREQIRMQAEQRIALAREQALRSAAEEARHRSAFLAEASAVLQQTLDLDATMRSFVRLMVPAIAAESWVTVLEHPDGPWTTDRARRTADGVVVDRLEGEQALELSLVEGIRRAAMTLEPERLLGGTNGSKLERLVIPIALRGVVLGAVSLERPAAADGTFSPDDVALATDLTARAAQAIENARLYRAIQDNDRRKNEFLAMLAHELRNPLAPMATAAEMLRISGHDAMRVAGAREVIERQVKHMARLVDDLLDVARISSGKVRMETQPVEIANVIAHAVELVRPLIEKRKHELTLRLPPRAVLVNGDQARLSQVVANLLNNAAKYTDDGGRISINVAETDPHVVISVRDSGIGMSRAVLPRIFDLFVQGERSLERSQGGLGVGLTVVRRLVELHCGWIEARSDGPGRGSEFIVTLPKLASANVDMEAINGLAAPSPAATAHFRRVLVVDDNVDAAQMLGELLEMRGHEVAVSNDGPSAVEAAESFRPDLVLLDVGLPGLDGYEVARRIRAIAGLQDVLLVAITGYGQDSDKVRAKEAGFDHHLVKPVDTEVLNSLMARRARAQAN